MKNLPATRDFIARRCDTMVLLDSKLNPGIIAEIQAITLGKVQVK